MQTSLAFLGVLSSVLIGSQFVDEAKIANPVQKASYTPDQTSNTAVWKITVTGSNTSCDITSAIGSNTIVATRHITACNEAIPGIIKLGKIDINPTGDIALVSKSGKILARFMESESDSHESVWPKYPLMTLTQINRPNRP